MTVTSKEDKIKKTHEQYAAFIGFVMERMAEKCIQRNLSFAQLRLLFVLSHQGPATVGKIALSLSIGQSAASLLIDKLVVAKLATRIINEQDRRKALVSLTDAGKALMGQGQPLQKKLLEWLNQLGEQQLDTLSEAFQALIDIGSNDVLKKQNHEKRDNNPG